MSREVQPEQRKRDAEFLSFPSKRLEHLRRFTRMCQAGRVTGPRYLSKGYSGCVSVGDSRWDERLPCGLSKAACSPQCGGPYPVRGRPGTTAWITLPSVRDSSCLQTHWNVSASCVSKPTRSGHSQPQANSLCLLTHIHTHPLLLWFCFSGER